MVKKMFSRIVLAVPLCLIASAAFIGCGGGGSSSNGVINPPGPSIADVGGSWNLYHTQTGGTEQGPDFIAITQTGNSISGTATIGSSVATITGTVSGANITFSLVFGGGWTTSLTGTVSADGSKMSGTYSNQDSSGTWRSAALTSISVTPLDPSASVGSPLRFTATGAFADGTTQNITTAVIWSSSDSAIATIGNAAGSNGLATSEAVGSTTITASAGGIAGSTTFAVTQSQSLFQGSLEGTWSIVCPAGLLPSGLIGYYGPFASTIDANGNVTGSFSERDFQFSGSISGHIDSNGSLTGSFNYNTSGSNNPLSWQGQFTISGISLSGLGELTSSSSPEGFWYGCEQGMWQGTGTASH